MSLTSRYAKEHGVTLNVAKRILRQMKLSCAAEPVFVQPAPQPYQGAPLPTHNQDPEKGWKGPSEGTDKKKHLDTSIPGAVDAISFGYKDIKYDEGKTFQSARANGREPWFNPNQGCMYIGMEPAVVWAVHYGTTI
jgi:hypothetical protein